jgi:hypothetical protein
MPRSVSDPIVALSSLSNGLLSSTIVPPEKPNGTDFEGRLRPTSRIREPVEMKSQTAVEILDSNELALRLKVKESWVIEQSKRSRTSDPIPVFRLGKHRRYRWGSPEMNDWLSRRVTYTTTHRAGAH